MTNRKWKNIEKKKEQNLLQEIKEKKEKDERKEKYKERKEKKELRSSPKLHGCICACIVNTVFA